MSKASIEEQVADQIIALLDQGELPPWDRPWHSASLQRNAISDAPYRGINQWLTGLTSQARNYNDPRWVTYRQAAKMGGHVARGEKGTMVVFWKMIPRQDASADDERDHYPVARAYRVFNLEQTRGCDFPSLPAPPTPHNAIEQAEAIIAGMPDAPPLESVRHGNEPPCYIPSIDAIRVPHIDRYDVAELWYNSVFHEITHATGHPKRLHRFETDHSRENLHHYAVEELIAGMGSAMLSAHAGIAQATLITDAAYIAHWRDAIRADKPIVLQAAQRAQRAVDFIIQTRHAQNDDDD